MSNPLPMPPPPPKDGLSVISREVDWDPEGSFAKQFAKRRPQSQTESRPSSFIRRFLGAPLRSNPITPPITPHFYIKHKSTAKESEPPTPVSVTRPAKSHLTINTRSSALIPWDQQPNFHSPNPRADPYASKVRKAGVSYSSWTTTPTTTTASQRRDTIMTEESEAPRFRTIASWVNQQTKRTHTRNFSKPLTQLPPTPTAIIEAKRGQHSELPRSPPLPPPPSRSQ
jgi:hypothetical protein